MTTISNKLTLVHTNSEKVGSLVVHLEAMGMDDTRGLFSFLRPITRDAFMDYQLKKREKWGVSDDVTFGNKKFVNWQIEGVYGVRLEFNTTHVPIPIYKFLLTEGWIVHAVSYDQVNHAIGNFESGIYTESTVISTPHRIIDEYTRSFIRSHAESKRMRIREERCAKIASDPESEI